MKFTKRAYVKVWQNCPEDQREDTTITLQDYEDANELNSIPVALLYLLERHAFVNSMDEFNVLEHCLTAEPCEEQIEAATVERSRHQILFSIDGIRKCCSCGAVVGGAWGDSRVAFERHVTMMMLEAARKAVM